MKLPQDHPQRIELNDEVHARPPQTLVTPLRLSYLALFSDGPLRERQWRQVVELAGRFGVTPPPPGATHYAADLGPFRLKWERHTEFSRYKFIVAGADGGDPFAEPAIDAVPADWVAGLAGQVLVASHAALLAAGDSSELVYVPNKNHISEIADIWQEDDPTAVAILRFLKTHR